MLHYFTICHGAPSCSQCTNLHGKRVSRSCAICICLYMELLARKKFSNRVREAPCVDYRNHTGRSTLAEEFLPDMATVRQQSSSEHFTTRRERETLCSAHAALGKLSMARSHMLHFGSGELPSSASTNTISTGPRDDASVVSPADSA